MVPASATRCSSECQRRLRRAVSPPTAVAARTPLLFHKENDPMPQATEPRTTSQPNIQDVFLNFARRERLTVSVHLIDGRQFDARIKNFDRFAVVVEVNGADHLVFKHAIATIATERSIANYLSSQHP